MLLSAVAVWGCSNKPPPDSAAVASQPEPDAVESLGVDAPEGDFRGLRWGDTKDEVIAAESKRSKTISGGWSYETKLAGYPVTVSYGYFDDDRLGGGSYEFPWPGEATICTEVMTAGSECSLKSAEYAIAVCERIAGLLTDKYPSKEHLDPKVVHSSVSSVSDLERRMRSNRGDQIDLTSNAWANERVSVFQFFSRGRKPGQGWRCSFMYYPSPEINEKLDAEATASQNQAAKRDL